MKNLPEKFRALADETRIRTLMLIIRHGELCVCDIIAALEITQSKASRHLRYLKHAGFLDDRRDGIWMHYRLSESCDPSHRAILAALEAAVPRSEIEQLNHRLNASKKTAACASPTAKAVHPRGKSHE